MFTGSLSVMKSLHKALSIQDGLHILMPMLLSDSGPDLIRVEEVVQQLANIEGKVIHDAWMLQRTVYDPSVRRIGCQRLRKCPVVQRKKRFEAEPVAFRKNPNIIRRDALVEFPVTRAQSRWIDRETDSVAPDFLPTSQYGLRMLIKRRKMLRINVTNNSRRLPPLLLPQFISPIATGVSWVPLPVASRCPDKANWLPEIELRCTDRQRLPALSLRRRRGGRLTGDEFATGYCGRDGAGDKCAAANRVFDHGFCPVSFCVTPYRTSPPVSARSRQPIISQHGDAHSYSASLITILPGLPRYVRRSNADGPYCPVFFDCFCTCFLLSVWACFRSSAARSCSSFHLVQVARDPLPPLPRTRHREQPESTPCTDHRHSYPHCTF